jgi:hypothetical protein
MAELSTVASGASVVDVVVDWVLAVAEIASVVITELINEDVEDVVVAVEVDISVVAKVVVVIGGDEACSDVVLDFVNVLRTGELIAADETGAVVVDNVVDVANDVTASDEVNTTGDETGTVVAVVDETRFVAVVEVEIVAGPAADVLETITDDIS